MSNNLYEGIKIFIVCVCVLALNTMVTLQLRSCLHLPASSQTPAGSWQSPRGLIVSEPSQGAEPRLLLQLSPAARSSSSLGQLKMTSLPAVWAHRGAELRFGWMLLPTLHCLLSFWQRLIHPKFSMPQSFSLWLASFWYITAVPICKAK